MRWFKDYFTFAAVIAVGYLPPVSSQTNSIEAQVIPDRTLPVNSIVNSASNVNEITGGSLSGNNLFHSFREFSIPTGASAFFNQALTIQNIISRVTGGATSNIDGLIRANGTANLFLLNPNGIIFGKNAKLDIGGSFMATTADSFKFADGLEFSAVNPAVNPLLSINVPLGLQFGNNPSGIISRAQTGNTGLEVRSNKTLALVGGDISIEGGYLLAPQGRIELGSVAANALVSLTPSLTASNQNWILGYQNVGGLRDILLSQAAFVSTTGDRGGDIQVQGRQIVVKEGSGIAANTKGSLAGGTLSIVGSELVEVVGKSRDDAFLSSLTAAVEPNGTGIGGNLRIQTDRLIVRDGGQILTATFGAGNAGNLSVDAKSIELSGTTTTGDGEFASGLFASAEKNSIGSGGNIVIDSDRIVVKDGAQVVATTFGSGKAGNINVHASEIALIGTNPKNPAGVSGFKTAAEIGSTGNGGNLSITTGSLLIRDGAEAQVSTLGVGNAGSLNLQASSIELVGRTFNGEFASALRAVSGLEGVLTDVSGSGGDLNITTRDLIVRDGADIRVSATGTGAAGNLTIQANSVRLNNQAALRAETRTGDRGNITIQSQDLQLRNNSAVSTNSTSTATGGNININTGVLVGLENSDITANSIASFGGQVNIQSQSIFGIANRPITDFNTSDITASSSLGAQFSGTVEIKTPDVDPSKGLVTLTAVPVDASRLIAQRCLSDRRENELIITGRGGLPPNPEAVLGANRILEDLGNTSNHKLSIDSVNDPSIRLSDLPSSHSIEAQTWIKDANGDVILIASTSGSNLYTKTPRCNLR